MPPFQHEGVARSFANYPPPIRRKLLTLRNMIFDVAASTEGVGPIEETLKWGEPAYLTTASKSGSTIRMDWKSKQPTQYAMYFNCKTTLVETFRTMFPNDFTFEGNRAIVFRADEELPLDTLEFCICAALTYHRS